MHYPPNRPEDRRRSTPRSKVVSELVRLSKTSPGVMAYRYSFDLVTGERVSSADIRYDYTRWQLVTPSLSVEQVLLFLDAHPDVRYLSLLVHGSPPFSATLSVVQPLPPVKE